jgi:hypothetical protein
MRYVISDLEGDAYETLIRYLSNNNKQYAIVGAAIPWIKIVVSGVTENEYMELTNLALAYNFNVQLSLN